MSHILSHKLKLCIYLKISVKLEFVMFQGRKQKLREMGRNSNVGEDSLKAGWLTKRSQFKARFAAFATNYKDRWFVLTRTALIYYDSQDPGRRKERGRLQLKEVKLVEKVSLKDREEPSGAFQIGYTQNSSQESLMCIIAKSDVERDEWIALIRNLIR